MLEQLIYNVKQSISKQSIEEYGLNYNKRLGPSKFIKGMDARFTGKDDKTIRMNLKVEVKLPFDFKYSQIMIIRYMARLYPGAVNPKTIYKFYNDRFSYDTIRRDLKKLEQRKIVKEDKNLALNQNITNYKITDLGLWYYSRLKNDFRD